MDGWLPRGATVKNEIRLGQAGPWGLQFYGGIAPTRTSPSKRSPAQGLCQSCMQCSKGPSSWAAASF